MNIDDIKRIYDTPIKTEFAQLNVPKKSGNHRKVTGKERHEIYNFWKAHPKNSRKATAKHFNRSVATVDRIVHSFNIDLKS